MKSFISGWRGRAGRAADKAVAAFGGERQVATAPKAPPPAGQRITVKEPRREPAPERRPREVTRPPIIEDTESAEEPRRSPFEWGRRRNPPARRGPAAYEPDEIIDAPRAPRRAAQPISFPSVRFPANSGQWLMLIVALGLFKLSADATHAALGTWIDWNTAVMIQAAISSIERFHFAGNRNGFTWFVLAVDTALTATGLGMELLPNLFVTPLYDFVTLTLLGGFGAEGFTGLSLGVLALGVGFIIAYGGDKTLDLATGRQG